MAQLFASEDVIDELKDLRIGIHAALDALVGHDDKDRAEMIFRQIDIKVCALIDDIKPVSR